MRIFNGERGGAFRAYERWSCLPSAALSLSATVAILGLVACGSVVVQSDGTAAATAQGTTTPAPSTMINAAEQCSAGLRCAP